MATVTGKTSEAIDAQLATTILSVALGDDGAVTYTRRNGQVVSVGTVGNDIVSATINSSWHLILTTRAGATIDAGSVGPPTAPVSPLQSWPVGSVYIGVTPANPSTLLGGGTWDRFAEGRVVVGVDSTQTEFDAVEETGGAKTVVITEANLPQHDHTMAHTHQPANSADNFLINDNNGALNRANGGNFNAVGQGATGPSSAPKTGKAGGTSEPVNNLPPFITAYLWKRTA